MAVRWSELDEKTQQRIKVQQPEVAQVLGEQVKPTPLMLASAKKKKRTHRSWYAWLAIALLTVLAYIIQGTGIFIGYIGDALWIIAQRIHEGKWKLT